MGLTNKFCSFSISTIVLFLIFFTTFSTGREVPAIESLMSAEDELSGSGESGAKVVKRDGEAEEKASDEGSAEDGPDDADDAKTPVEETAVAGRKNSDDTSPGDKDSSKGTIKGGGQELKKKESIKFTTNWKKCIDDNEWCSMGWQCCNHYCNFQNKCATPSADFQK